MVYRRDFRNVKRKDSFFQRSSLTMILIILNVVLFLIFLLVLSVNESFLEFIAIKPSNFLTGGYLWTLLTSMFMHGGFFHLFVNMFSLFFLGSLAEKIIGRRRFFWLYLSSGIVGGLFFVLFAFLGQFVLRGDFIFGGMNDFAVGASGALFGILGVLAVILPKKEIYLIAGPIIVIVLQFLIGGFATGSTARVINFAATALIFIMIFAIFSSNLFLRKLAVPIRLPFWAAPIAAIVPLVAIGFFVKLPIGNTAHFGGLVVGLIYGAYLRSKYSKKVKMLNKIIR